MPRHRHPWSARVHGVITAGTWLVVAAAADLPDRVAVTGVLLAFLFTARERHDDAVMADVHQLEPGDVTVMPEDDVTLWIVVD